ncbi:site-2 protease family protein [Alphaproteobacteria bacterium]|jgi:Zn-dependent protease|nr:site-2 protease family protein [Alphaproteobacteria bacterium]
MPDLLQIAERLSIWALPVLIAITLHEAAHAWAAHKLGDDTAHRMGRVSFNPLVHVDPLGTIVFPLLCVLMPGGFLFGWAKPVPVFFGGLRNPKRDMVLVAAAGPLVNFALAIVAAVGLNIFSRFTDSSIATWLVSMFEAAIIFNLVLAFFNLIPIPPLDGGRIAVGLLPMSLAKPLARLEKYGFMIIIGCFLLLPMLLEPAGINFSLFDWLVLKPLNFVLPLFEFIVGI